MENSSPGIPPKKSNIELVVYFVAILLVGGLAFFAGTLYQKVQSLESGGTKVAANNQGAAPTQPSLTEKLSKDKADKLPKVIADEKVQGDIEKAELYLIEYSDLQCPYCSRFHPTAEKVFNEYKGKVAWVYRHFPLDSIHPKARPAAIASECVRSLKGDAAFWSFTDKIFDDQTRLDDIAAIAKEVEVNETAFETCTTEKKVEAIVNEQYQGGSAAGVTGTPGVFLVNAKTGDTWIIRGALPYEQLKPLVDEALK